MQAVKLQTEDLAPAPLAPAYVRAARLSLARSHMALFPTRLALARWTGGGSLPHLAGNATPPLRTAWLACAQRDFQAWLENGGFTQYDDELDNALQQDMADSDGAA